MGDKQEEPCRIVCTACMCGVAYCRAPDRICSVEFEECLCFGSSCTCPSAGAENVPSFCGGCLPCCILPVGSAKQFGCCKKVKDLAKEDQVQHFDAAAEACPVSGCCIPGLCSTTSYCIAPRTICGVAQAQFLCAEYDCAFPICLPHIPKYCALYGLMCYPFCKCCAKTSDLPKPGEKEGTHGAEPPMGLEMQGSKKRQVASKPHIDVEAPVQVSM